jgi:succinoglycan biosynthesis transport protein ExoP
VDKAVEQVIGPGTNVGAVRGAAGDTRDSWVAATTQSAFAPRGIQDYVRIIYRHRWLVALTFVVVTVPIAAWGILQPPAYEAGVRLVLDPEPTVPVSFEDASRRQASSPDTQAQQEVVRSRDVVRRTILALRLWERPAAAALVAPSPLARIKTVLHLAPAASPAPDPGAQAGDDARADALIGACVARIKVISSPVSRLVDVVFEAPDATLSSDFANELARQFIKQDIEVRVVTARESSAWLTARVTEQGRKVEASEAALQQYKEQRGALAVDDRQNIVAQKLSDLNAAVTRARTERLAREGAYKQVQQAGGNTAALESIPAIAATGSVQQARTQLADLQRQQLEASQRYGDRHPTIVKYQTAIQNVEQTLQDRVNSAAQVIKNEYLAALAQEQALTRGLDEQKTSALQLNEQNLEYGRLQREAETNRQVYNSLLQQLQQVGITGRYEQSAIRVIEAARAPLAPVRPKRTMFAALALAIGLCAALGLAFVREFTDPRIKTPKQLEEYLQLPFLGLIPDMKPVDGAERPTFEQLPPSPFADALRRVRANLRLAAPARGPHILLVTSAVPREGKTTVCVGLAQCFAIAMPRVLVIDADLRRPCVHRTIALDSRTGLSEYLAGKADVDDVIQTTAFENLWVIASGSVPENPSELLGYARMVGLLEAVRGRFDWILIDTAPVLSAPDAEQLAQLASGILLVVAAEMTPREDVMRAEQELAKTRVPFAGCVLNRARVEHHGYYYAPYYNKAYQSYYSKPS